MKDNNMLLIVGLAVVAYFLISGNQNQNMPTGLSVKGMMAYFGFDQSQAIAWLQKNNLPVQ